MMVVDDRVGMSGRTSPHHLAVVAVIALLMFASSCSMTRLALAMLMTLAKAMQFMVARCIFL